MVNSNKVERWHKLALDLKQYANSQGISQQQIAGMSGVSLKTISRAFTLQICPSLDKFIKIADALNVSVKVLK